MKLVKKDFTNRQDLEAAANAMKAMLFSVEEAKIIYAYALENDLLFKELDDLLPIGKFAQERDDSESNIVFTLIASQILLTELTGIVKVERSIKINSYA